MTPTTRQWRKFQARSSFRPSEYLGALVFIDVLSAQEEQTKFGLKLTIRANVSVLTDEVEETYSNVTLFGTVIVDDLASQVGETVLARIGSRPSKQKGAADAIILEEPSEDDYKIGEECFKAHASSYKSQEKPKPQESPARKTATPWAKGKDS